MIKNPDYCLKKYRKLMPKTSARRSQLIAKCRNKRGEIRVGEAGKRLKRWQDEKWVNVNSKGKKPCGSGGNHYCRPSVKVSRQTPTTIDELSDSQKKYRVKAKRKKGMGNILRVRS